MKLLLALQLLLTLNPTLSAVGNCSSLEKRETIVGTVVAQYTLPLCVCHPCAAWLIVRLKNASKARPTFVRVVVEYFPNSNSPDNGYPTELVKSAVEWKFEAVRFEEGDGVLERFLKVEDIATKQDITEQTAASAWLLLPGAAKEQLPFGEVLRCYEVTNGRYKRTGSGN